MLKKLYDEGRSKVLGGTPGLSRHTDRGMCHTSKSKDWWTLTIDTEY